MDISRLLQGAAFFCLGIAIIFWTVRAGKKLKDNKRQIEDLGKRLEDLGKPDDPRTH
jgi:hypothetical protein